MENEKSDEVTLTSGGEKQVCRRSIISIDSECELQCVMEATRRNTMQMSINSDTTTVTRMASDLTRSFSMIAKEQSSIMDYGGMAYSIRPV